MVRAWLIFHRELFPGRSFTNLLELSFFVQRIGFEPILHWLLAQALLRLFIIWKALSCFVLVTFVNEAVCDAAKCFALILDQGLGFGFFLNWWLNWQYFQLLVLVFLKRFFKSLMTLFRRSRAYWLMDRESIGKTLTMPVAVPMTTPWSTRSRATAALFAHTVTTVWWSTWFLLMGTVSHEHLILF